MAEHPNDIQHVVACPDCQARAILEGLDVDLDQVWQGVAAGVWARPVGPVERWATWLLRSPGLARALTTTPSLVVSWILASAVVLVVGVILTESSGYPWFALVTPALAGIGVAYAYGPGVDPAFELSRTMAISDRMVLLVRVPAVFGVNALLGLAASVATSSALGLTLGWLLPMTAVSMLGLAAATLTRSANLGVAAALSGWGLIVLASAYDAGELTAAVEWRVLAPFYLVASVLMAALVLYATSGRRIGDARWL